MCSPCLTLDSIAILINFSYLNYVFVFFFFFNDTATTEIYTLSLHDALPIYFTPKLFAYAPPAGCPGPWARVVLRSEEHTSELQSQSNLVCRLLLEKKKKKHDNSHHITETARERLYLTLPLSHTGLLHASVLA